MDTNWYAVDADGHVAMFNSGENGHAPIHAEDAFHLSALYRARHPDDPDGWDTYEGLAEEFGFFLYDYGVAWDPIDTYERSVVPPRPVHVEQLPPEVRDGCKKLRLPTVRFGEAERIQPMEFFPCAYWYEEDRVAYLAADGVTVRAVRGKERQFPDFVRRIRAERPDEAARYRFEGHDD